MVAMTDFIIVDGPGPDFVVYENAFQVAPRMTDPEDYCLTTPIEDVRTFVDLGIVSVSEDGVNFREFPCDVSTHPYRGCAGVRPVLSNNTNRISPRNPALAGGDVFDLATIGLRRARFIRIQDSGILLGPIGETNAGFDLDAIAVINGITQ